MSKTYPSPWKPIDDDARDGREILAILDFEDGYPAEVAVICWSGMASFPWRCRYNNSDAVRGDIPKAYIRVPNYTEVS